MNASSNDELNEFREAMDGRRVLIENIGDETILTTSQGYDNTDLFEVVAFVKQIMATEELAFVTVPLNIFAGLRKKLSLSKYYDHINYFMEAYQEGFAYNPYIELFYSTLFELVGKDYSFFHEPYVKSGFCEKTEADVFNDLISNIRRKANSKEFKKKVSSIEFNSSRNEVSSIDYVQRLFECYARLLSVRVDFFFSNKDGEVVSVAEATSYMNRFMNNKRTNSIFKNLVGYIWKLEEGNVRGLHYHCLFFFDGSKARKDVFIGMQIGNYWKKVTKGRGVYFNVNANKKDFLSKGMVLGIGMIDHYNTEGRASLLNIVKYFFKPDQYLSAKSVARGRVFAKGRPPKVSGTGRPRSVAS
ncbi:YagK/YfjJ domain-containing protein [Massilia orientalis]|uniref:Inovirus-type Gp2 protein n=1 Tax=Massilia orientalis TaxID=3050128 RepID=A0ACC7MG43_9BURK|nr:inovirus-type Gp2 protein [Massilia sp. YIM B02787]